MIDAVKHRLPSGVELAADRLVHVIGIAVGLAGAIALVGIAAARGDPVKLAAVAVYAVGLIAMLGCSAAYNLARSGRRRELLRRFDHAAIFVMIAGTYTPFTTRLESGWAVGLTVLVWSVAILGLVIKVGRPLGLDRLLIGLYLGLGWIGVIAARPFLASLGSTTVALLAAGGVLYSVGVVFHVWRSLPFQNAIWHGFVLAAALVHYVAVLDGVVIAHVPA